MMKIRLILFITFFLLFTGYNVALAQNLWKIVLQEDKMGRTYKTAEVKNDRGFYFTITGTKPIKAGIFIPSGYNPVSDRGYFLKIQIDNNQILKPIYVTLNGNAVFYPDNEFINQLRKGNIMRVSYYSTSGWSGAVQFSLKGSNKAISEVLVLK